MEREEWILVKECCTNYNLDSSFVHWLGEHELIHIHTVEQQEYIPHQQLSLLEQFMRMHYELDINLEGIEAISHMLQRVQQMQQEINQLRNRLRLYETGMNSDIQEL